MKILIKMLMYAWGCIASLSACSGDDSESNEIFGSWYNVDETCLMTIDVLKIGNGVICKYDYESDGWHLDTLPFDYTLSDDIAIVQFANGDAMEGKIAITGSNFSLSTDEKIWMWKRFNGKQSFVDELKKKIEDNWLCVSPKDSIHNEDLFLTESGFKDALYGIFHLFAKYEAEQLNLEHIRIYKNDIFNENNPHNNIITSNNPVLLNVWEKAYNLIAHANNFIKYSERECGFSTEKYLNSALVIRSLVYYNISMLWGKVPYVENYPANNNAPWLTFDDIREKIKVTLQDIQGDFYLPEEIYYAEYYVNKETVTALLGEIALWDKDSKRALELFKDCNANFSSSLLSDDEYSIVLGDKIPNYTSQIIKLLKQEAEGNITGLVEKWQALNNKIPWGYWNMLRRTSKAQEVCGCSEAELLMPLPVGNQL